MNTHQAFAVLIGCTLSGAASAVFIGPTSPYYLDNYFTSQIYVVQGSSVINYFPLSAYSGNVSNSQGSLAVGSTVNTHGFSASADSGLLAGQYSLSGTPNGTSYSSFPLTPGFTYEHAYDGTTDGTHNYYVQNFALDAAGAYVENVIQTDLNWQNPVSLFSVQSAPGRTGEYLGITYDALNNSLWVAGYGLSVIADYSLSGALLSSFNPGSNGLSALAFDAADNTLWVSSGTTSLLSQYSTSGTLLQSGTPSGLPSYYYLAGEFAEFGPSVPEPATLALLGLGLAGIGFTQRRNRDPSHARFDRRQRTPA